jgi:kynurenine formamidase
VLLRTDWPGQCQVESERFWRDAPFTGRSACEWLVARRETAVGYDYPPDYSIRTMIFEPATAVTRHDCTTHDVFFPAGITVVEYLNNLDQVGVPRCRFLALPLKRLCPITPLMPRVLGQVPYCPKTPGQFPAHASHE